MTSAGRGTIRFLDGGQATHLETLGYDLSSALWSASLLSSSDVKDDSAIEKVHEDYLRSGAEAIGTLTYQLSDKACAKAGWNHAEIAKVESLFEKAIVLADRARQNLGREKAKAVLTFGPYGAALANGSEYTGDYSEPGSSHQPSFAELEHFHLHRLRQALRSSVADKIDTIAFETIPRLDEAEAILSALKVLASEMGSSQRRKPPAYISFVFPPESRGYLPWSSDSTSRKGPADIAQSICQAQSSLDWPIAGLGINCTKPTMLKLVAEELSRAVHDHGTTPDLSLFIYPDGGLIWDGINRMWLRPDGIPAAKSQGTSSDVTHSWAQELVTTATSASVSGAWQTVWVGGCCQTGPTEIARLGEFVKQDK